MSGRQFIPEPEDQAEEILELLRDHGFDVDGVEPEDIVPTIDSEKPVSVNLRTVADGLKGTLR